jgi:hypothetical protein
MQSMEESLCFLFKNTGTLFSQFENKLRTIFSDKKLHLNLRTQVFHNRLQVS